MWASIGDVSEYSARVDAQVRAVLGRVLAQRRSVEVAFGYVTALAPGVRANCWAIAEEAGMRGRTRCRRCWARTGGDWGRLRGELANDLSIEVALLLEVRGHSGCGSVRLERGSRWPALTRRWPRTA